jgi:hypothetical protein
LIAVERPGCLRASENNCCGNGVIELGEACENPDGIICNSQCLLLGNTNTGQEVCGNGVIEEREACDFAMTQW